MKLKLPGLFWDVTIKDLHSDPVDGITFLPKILPSSIRKKLIEDGIKTGKSEVMTISKILIDHYKDKI